MKDAKNYRRYGLIAAVLVCLLYSCQPTSQAADPKVAAKPAVPAPTSDVLSIEGPGRVLEVGEYVSLQIKGMAADAMSTAKVVHYPRENVAVVPAQTWGGEPFIWFGARATGKYLVTVVVRTEKGLAAAEVEIEVGDPSPPPPPPPPPNPYEPDKEWKDDVQPLLSFKLERADADALAGMYAAVAAQLSGADAIETTAQLRGLLVERGKVLGIRGKYSGLAETMDQVLVGALTLENRPLDRAEAVKLLHTVAWAVWETGKEDSTRNSTQRRKDAGTRSGAASVPAACRECTIMEVLR